MEFEWWNQNGGYQGPGGMGSYCLMCEEFQLYKMKRLLWMDGGDGSTAM